MDPKQIVIELEELPHFPSKYRVRRVVNSVEFKIDEILSETEVQELLSVKPNIKTVIKPNRKQKG